VILEKLKSLSLIQASLARDTIWLIILNIVQKSFGLITTYVLVRYLSTTAYGEYNFILTIMGLVVVTTLPSLDDAVMQSVSRGFVGTYKDSLKIKFLSSLVGTLILAGFGAWFFVQNSLDLAYGFFIVSVFFPFSYGFTQWKRLRIGQGNFGSVTKTDGLSSIITSLLIVGLVVAIPETIIVPLIVLLLIKALLDLWLTAIICREINGDNKAEEGSIRYGVRTSFFSIFGKSAMAVDKVMIFFFLSPASLAIYVAAEKLPELIKTLIKSLSAALAPRFAKQDHYTARVDNALKLFSLLTFIVLIGFTFTLMPAVMLLIFGEAYAESIPYGQALMCITAIGNIAPLKGRFFKSKLDTKSMRDFLISTSLIRVVASVVCIPLWGLNGAVLSYFIARMSTNIAVYIIMKKRYPVKK
jgi:O-antigen/teichoic acid export membrane protein